jgi:lipoprotein NlpD
LTPPAVVARAAAPAPRPAKPAARSRSARAAKPPPAAAPAPALPAEPPPRWQWPTDGEVVVQFGAPGGIATGIAISGRDGQPVRAAAAGRVVYAGGGLINYGQLVIIKHNETFLSAYGFNRELLVAQGQDVARGQPIALMGTGPERQPRLHFEIRRNGLPVDPLLFVVRR